VSTTLCDVLKLVLPVTARPAPQNVSSVPGRWEFVTTYGMWPGGQQALHFDPTRCFWQICLTGCDEAFLQVGKVVKRYVEGDMVAFDASYDHSVWVRPGAKIPRIVLHGSLHYCQGGYS